MDTSFSDNNNNYTEKLEKRPLIERKHIYILTVIGVLLLFVVIYFVLSSIKPHPQQQNPNMPASPTATPVDFSILNTTPSNGEVDVYPGEITITFTTNAPINSGSEYSLNFNPPLQNEPLDTTLYPSQNITQGIVGGLSQNTTYAVSVNNSSGEQIYSWSFTTSDEIPESSSRESLLEQENAIKNYYPLFYELPYQTNSFKIDYTDRLTLEVVIYSGTQETVSPIVDEWIRENGVNPQSHTITYTR